MNKKSLKTKEEKCTIEGLMSVVGGKWSMPIIHSLSSGKKRFKELERNLPNINTRMLVKELKNLEENRVVKREAYATVPPTVEYSLTISGEALVPIIIDLHLWGRKYIDEQPSENENHLPENQPSPDNPIQATHL